MKFEFFRTDLQKYSNIKFHENPSSGTELFHADGQRDRMTAGHDEANSCLRNFANAPKSEMKAFFEPMDCNVCSEQGELRSSRPRKPLNHSDSPAPTELQS